ncbi:MAG: phosphate ABC transporter substrate-binding protein PstS [Thermoplasmatota archaeon]
MRNLLVAASLALVAILAGCTASNAPPVTSTPATPSSTSTAPTNPATTTLAGSLSGDGSTFVAPLMDKWRTAYDTTHNQVQISYTGGGSGKGRTDITKDLVDFAASDAPMKDAEIANATDILHIPDAAGGVVIVYNVPEVGATPLKFDAATIAGIFLGKITTWNAPELAALNPGVPLPAQTIAVVHRSDSSGTTDTFTDFLNKAAPAWQTANGGPGHGGSVNWPTGTGAPGNSGVGTQVQEVTYAIGYVGNDWSDLTKLQSGVVKNVAGNFVAASPETASNALASAIAQGAFDARLRGSATNAAGPDSYPITAVTWILVHQHQTDVTKGKILADFLWYVIHDGQAVNPQNSYAAMPASIVAKAETFVDSMDANGAPLR